MAKTLAFWVLGRMKIGYARVSTGEQNLDLQIDALKKAGCEKIFTDKTSGVKSDRPGLDEAVDYVREGDTLVVWKLSRFARSLKDMVGKVNDLRERGIGFTSLTEKIDLTTKEGRFQFAVFAAMAELQREIIIENTRAGLLAARARGKLGGRKPALSPGQVQMASKLIKNKEIPIREICDTLSISKTTLYRYVSPEGQIRKKVERANA